MKAILNNTIELNPIMVTGARKFIAGANRDCLTFVFQETSMDELDEYFTEANCERITLVEDDGTEYVHTGYVVRSEITKKDVVVSEATVTDDEVREKRCFVSMGQRTYAETQMATLAEEVTYTQLALCEVYEAM